MIRVVYRWRVDPERQVDFVAWWHEGTLAIRESQPGGKGTTLLHPTNDHDILIGEVVRAHVSDGAPLVHFASRYRKLALD